MKIKAKNNLKEGFIAFTSLLVISAVTLAIALSISLLGVGEAKSSLDYKKGVETYFIADSCGEEALYRLKSDPDWAGTPSLIVGNGECSISISGTLPDKLVSITATLSSAATYVKRMEISAKVSGGGVNVIYWKQIQ